MLHILGAPFTAPVTEVLEEDVCRAIEEDEEALHEFCGRTPFLAGLPRTHIPGLAQLACFSVFPCVQKGYTNPSELAKAARPATEGEDA
jgi:hypothetical protein